MKAILCVLSLIVTRVSGATSDSEPFIGYSWEPTGKFCKSGSPPSCIAVSHADYRNLIRGPRRLRERRHIRCPWRPSGM
ncbi:hypothetical protein BDW42DRAFT_177388 [Aspergillus taichungensis]|uniref:Uncharacterized protein n=1 Tax=Aspergillus taichungensis TaxID=482145 RepID=A0A2J5HJB6_9EURO|nr:hypothetical protein BDW42DRAFT_177388 [Aspergillus taichungensis]